MAQDRPTFRVKVDMVVLSFQVTDNKGHYMNGLKAQGFPDSGRRHSAEDRHLRRRQQAAGGSRRGRHPEADVWRSSAGGPSARGARRTRSSGTNVFVLFDTSNYMYRGFVYASDAIADFIRGLDRADSVAVYTYSRNLSRAAPLIQERNDAIFGLRKAVAGDDSALYNCLLLTLRDAAKVSGAQSGDRVLQRPRQRQHGGARRRARRGRGRRHSDLRDLHQRSEQGPDLVERVQAHLHRAPAGRSYFAKTWQKQVEAFESIREDLGNSYTITYYPQPNPNEGFRKITVELLSDAGKKYRVQVRPGYRPRGGF